MKQLEANCQTCHQVLLVDVSDDYDPTDPLGLLRLVVCETCLAKRYSGLRKAAVNPCEPKAEVERRFPYVD